MATKTNGIMPGQAAPGDNKTIRKLRSKSSDLEVQIEKLILLTEARPHHTHELRRFGISHPAGRIYDLEKRGFVYAKSRITTVDSDGFPHNGVALYELLSRPVGNNKGAST